MFRKLPLLLFTSWVFNTALPAYANVPRRPPLPLRELLPPAALSKPHTPSLTRPMPPHGPTLTLTITIRQNPKSEPVAINVSGQHVTSQDLHTIHLVPNLTSLFISQNPALGDAGMQQLTSCTLLSILDASETGIGDAAFKHFAKLPLKILFAAGNPKITGDGLGYLRGHPSLETLSLNDCPVESRHLEPLASCPKLSQLNLSGTKLDDAAIPLLVKIPNIKLINIQRTAISEDGRQRLARLLPGAYIIGPKPDQFIVPPTPSH